MILVFQYVKIKSYSNVFISYVFYLNLVTENVKFSQLHDESVI